jgi:hypothetical protein
MSKTEHILIKEDRQDPRFQHIEVWENDLKNLPEGVYKVLIKKLHKKATQYQFGWLFSSIYPEFLTAAIEQGWTDLTCIEDVDMFCKYLFSSREIISVETGEIMKLPTLKRKHNTLEMVTYCDQVRKWCSEYLYHDIPDPITKEERELIKNNSNGTD